MIARSTYKLVKDLIALMDKTSNVKSVTTVSINDYILNTCNTLWLQAGYRFTLNGQLFEIVSVDFNKSITIKSVTPITNSSFVIIPGNYSFYDPVFYHGTVRSTDSDLNDNTASGTLYLMDKLPMIWLHEPVENQQKIDLPNDRVVNLDIYFMANANFEIWNTDQHHELAIMPMINLCNRFLTVYGQSNPNDNETFTITELPRWGASLINRDNVQKTIFSGHNLSGVRLNGKFTFSDFSCDC